MNGNKHKAVWYLFTTMLSIFSICTILIFDGYNWPFYAVTANAIISLLGLVVHVHFDVSHHKHPAMLVARLLLLLNSISVSGFLFLFLNRFPDGSFMKYYTEQPTFQQGL